MSGQRDVTLELYETYRSYIRHEDGLINFRTTWFVTIQGVLFAVYGFSIQKRSEIFASITKDILTKVQDPDKFYAFFATVSGDQESPIKKALIRLDYIIHWIPMVGTVTGLVAFASIYAAVLAMRRVERSAEPHLPDFTAYSLPGLTGGGGASIPWFGLALGLVMPCVVVVFWVFSFFHLTLND
jgi:hypothetical protein